eukprot:148711-Hanusia_phi.AAC.1
MRKAASDAQPWPQGISLTAMKNACKALGVRKWPYHRPAQTADPRPRPHHALPQAEASAPTSRDLSPLPQSCGALRPPSASGEAAGEQAGAPDNPGHDAAPSRSSTGTWSGSAGDRRPELEGRDAGEPAQGAEGVGE